MKAIQRHTAEIRRERLAHKRDRFPAGGVSDFKREPPRLGARYGTDMSNMTSAFSELDSFINAARMRGAGYNAGLARSGWRVTARPPQKPYEPMLKDAYPRNEYTMMPVHNAPKYYTGSFMKYDYKDEPQLPSGDHNDGRPVVFKKQDIETVQTKKKYGSNPKGQSSVPLHLCNDTSSLLYQRSLQPETRDRAHLTSTASSELSSASALTYPYALHKQVKNEESALHPLKYTNPTQTWVNTDYPTVRRNQNRLGTTASSSTLFGPGDRLVNLESANLKSGRVRSAPEWFSEFFPRQKVADALKFMGDAKQSTLSSARKTEYDVNFQGKR